MAKLMYVGRINIVSEMTLELVHSIVGKERSEEIEAKMPPDEYLKALQLQPCIFINIKGIAHVYFGEKNG